MNFALLTVLLFIFVFPVLIASRAYSSGELSYKFTKTSIIDELVKSVFSAFIFHLITIQFVKLLGYKIDFNFISSLILQKNDSDVDFKILERDWLNIIGYFCCLFIFAFIFFFLFKNLIRFFRIDRKVDFFRYDNFWYYLLTGEILHIKEYNLKPELLNVDLHSVIKYVDVLTKAEKGEILYSGVLIEYQLAENDSIEFIVLSNPERQVFDKEGINKVDKIVIPSNYFIIPNKEILNYNILYGLIEKV